MRSHLHSYITDIIPHTHDIDLDMFITKFYKPEFCIAMCRECSNYGRRWGCPPLEGDFRINFSDFDRVRIQAIQIILGPETPPDAGMLGEILQLVRPQREAVLLGMERSLDGMAALFTGMCPHCPGAECARCAGQPCRHKHIVRPSLEALGFDLTAAARELFGIDMQWCHDNRAPEYLLLVGAVFYNTGRRIDKPD